MAARKEVGWKKRAVRLCKNSVEFEAPDFGWLPGFHHSLSVFSNDHRRLTYKAEYGDMRGRDKTYTHKNEYDRNL